MKALLQRVSQASVQVGDATIAAIGPGLVVLLGVARDDTERQAARLAKRTLAARLFPSESHPMDRSVLDVGGEVLAVSQFTLAADTKKGNRPGFATTARAEVAEPLYDLYCTALAGGGGRVQTGRFGADMQVSLVNDGPVTIILDA
ncbi:MAG: D-tyrosyl-tRNA(Tyr) deacylase [Gammaproteobacteria bacterium]|nr:D-tyrosyl-tRNA(Tyr) deacylase [Gammaproteobacteria bacterium]MYB39228.1 D-tyrosyl-tRNA(Tyr) deacylase [Gammaproteobacteria bacterium]